MPREAKINGEFCRSKKAPRQKTTSEAFSFRLYCECTLREMCSVLIPTSDYKDCIVTTARGRNWGSFCGFVSFRCIVHVEAALGLFTTTAPTFLCQHSSGSFVGRGACAINRIVYLVSSRVSLFSLCSRERRRRNVRRRLG